MLRRLIVDVNRNILKCTKLRNPLLPVQQSQQQLQVTRHMGSYFDSRQPDTPDKYTQVEKSYDEWKYVEQLFPNEFVPEAPKDHKTTYPSGWKPPNPHIDLPYHIRRTKNHMIPVYFKMDHIGHRPHTKIRYVEGNIWALEKDIGKVLKAKYPTKTVTTTVDEVQRYVKIKGDYLDDVKEWVLAQGF